MYLHLGQDVVVRERDIIGIFDLEKASVSKRTKEFLSGAGKTGTVVTVSYEMPKSFVVAESGGCRTVYISQISTAALLRRSGKRTEAAGK